MPLINERCPKLGERSETLFIAAITTTLSLLTGASVALSQKNSLVSGPASLLPLSPQAQEKVQELAQESVQESVQESAQAQRSEKES